MKEEKTVTLCENCMWCNGKIEPKYERKVNCNGEPKLVHVYFCDKYFPRK